MPAGGMAEHHHALLALAPQEQAGRAQLIDDGGDGHLRAQIVAGNGDGDAARIEARGHVAVAGRMMRAPVAAMNENGEGAKARAGFGREKIDDLARRRPVRETQFGLRRRRAIGGGIAVQRANISGCSGTRARLLYSASKSIARIGCSRQFALAGDCGKAAGAASQLETPT